MLEGAGHAVALGALWLLLALGASLAAAAGLPVLRRLLRHAGAADRARAYLTYGLLPPVAAAVVVVLSLFPDATVWIVPDHCHGSDCTPHAPRITVGSTSGSVVIAMGGVLLVVLAVAAGHAAQRMRRRLRALDLLSAAGRSGAYAVVDSAQPVAWCAGLWRPRVFLSRGLLAQLSDAETRAVLAHEQAHATRRDNLRATLLRYATLLWPRSVRRRLLAELSLSTELVCDRAAVGALGSPYALAGLLHRLATGASAPGRPRLAFASTAVAARIRALRVDGAAPGPSDYAWLWLALLWCALIVTLLPLGHRSIEWLTAL